MNKAQNYWLYGDRVHDVIVIKIDPVPEDQVPSSMRVSYRLQYSVIFCYLSYSIDLFLKAWHLGVSSGRLSNGIIYGNVSCVNSLSCQYIKISKVYYYY